MKRYLFIAMTIVSVTGVLTAQEAEPEPTPEPTPAPTPAPDYSKPALRFIFRDFDEPTATSEPAGLAFERYGWVFRWVPIMGDGSTNDGAFGSASVNQPVDPFYMLNVSFPATARTAPSPLDDTRRSFSERRLRRQMLSITRQANERENDP